MGANVCRRDLKGATLGSLDLLGGTLCDLDFDLLSAATQLSQGELVTELAIALFQQDRLTLAQSARLAARPLLEMQRLLKSRGIALHYDRADLDQDLDRALQRSRP